MKIVRIEAWPVEFELKEPFSIAYETITSTTNVFVRLIPDQGPAAYGCSAPDMEITGESADTVMAAFAGPVTELVVGRDPLRRSWLLDDLHEPLAQQPAALAAIDMALHDLLGKSAGLPLHTILGGHQESIETSVTVGIVSLEKTVEQARDWADRGFRCLKLKGGNDAREDAERVLAVRDALGDAAEIRFDANQGYTVDEAIAFVERTLPARIELLEQPTHRGEPGLLGRVTDGTEIPIMADESLMNVRDAFRLASNQLVNMVNVKLMKVGGIARALHVDSVAHAAKLGVMVGCMEESGLAIAAGLHFALARPNIAYADLDGHLDLIGDPAHGAVLLEAGRLRPTGRPGLGFDLD